MTASDRRDRALLDLADLDRQVAAGDLTETEAAPLRLRYERAAADAIAELDAEPEQPAPVGSARSAAAEVDEDSQDELASDHHPGSGRRRLRFVAGFATALAVVLTAVVLLPAFVGQRPVGGFVTGNEAGGATVPSAVTPSAGRDLSMVSDAEMEALIAKNPNSPTAVGMRLALAQRYVAGRRYDRAVTHYLAVLQLDPNNAVAQAEMGWVTFLTGRPQIALALVDRALLSQPAMLDALWFKANILLYGTSDPGGAITVLRQMQRQKLSAAVDKQVIDLIDVAQARIGGG